jgi:hypothetical protein
VNKTFLQKLLLIAVFYCVPFFFVISPWHRFLLFVLGMLFGIVLLAIDENYFFQHYQEDSLSKLENMSGLGSNEVVEENPSESSSKFLVTRSTIFLLILAPLSLFVVSSTGSVLGSGLIFGILLTLIVEMWMVKSSSELFRQRYLSQLAVTLSKEQIDWVVIGATGYFLLLNIWAVFLR